MDSLVAAIASGDTAAFGAWMRGAERPLRHSLARFAAVVDTEAVLQETLLRIWQIAPRFTPDGRPHGLLRLAVRIAHNLAVSELRKTARAVPVDDDELQRALEEAERVSEPAAPDPLLRRRVEECRERLPSQPRAALNARLEGRGRRSDAALAQEIRMQKNTFLQNITRARRLLAECLRNLGVELADEITP